MRLDTKRKYSKIRVALNSTGNKDKIPELTDEQQRIRVLFKDFGLNTKTGAEYGFNSTVVWNPANNEENEDDW